MDKKTPAVPAPVRTDIVTLQALTDAQVRDVQALMHTLDPEITVTGAQIKQAVTAPGTHFFAAVTPEGHIAGCASLCVFDSPTGRKASVEDVVVAPEVQGQGIGRSLMEALILYARKELAPVDLHLTSRPARVAANGLYRSLGFGLRETNAYRLHLEAPEKTGQ